MNYALAIHTTTAQLGLALSNFAGDDRCQTWELGRSMSTHLHVHLQEFLQPQTWADLSFLAVAKGPGSFTSTRIGVVAARTLAQQLNLPLYAISTLAAFAWLTVSQESQADKDKDATSVDIAVQMPAQRGELFVGIYSIREQATHNGSSYRSPVLTTLLPDVAMHPDQWQQRLDTWERPYCLITTDENLGASVRSLLELAYAEWQQGDRPNWSSALPFYGQSSV
jgi:tRNA threonylcarbamoyl adenosine modification protein YeaZ